MSAGMIPLGMYDDRSMMAHEAETIIPGSFVVLQGSAGDGMSDTTSTCPILPVGDDPSGEDADTQQQQLQGDQQPPRSSPSEEFHHVENQSHSVVAGMGEAGSVQRQRPAPLLGQLASQKRTAATMGIMSGTCLHSTGGSSTATSAPGPVPTATSRNSNSLLPSRQQPRASSSPANDDFIVVTDDQASEPSNPQPSRAHASASTHVNNDALDLKAIEDWKQSCRYQEIRQRKDFRESLHQTASALMDHTLTKIYNEQDMWWQSEGRLAIFRDLPTRLHNGTVLRSVLGTLSPGTTIVATDIVYLNSQTLTRLAVNPLLSSGGMAPHNIFPKGRLGWIQMIRIDSDGRTGYACLSLDGYALMAPGLPSLYTDPHVWIWRVTCPAGAFVREGLALQTKHLDTLPYGSLIRVTRRTINGQGLSRLLIHAMVPDDTNQSDARKHKSHASGNNANNKISPNKRWIDGWISEFLNPQSGQRGIVAQPLGFPVPALYRVTLTLGAVIRSDIELSSPQIGIAPMGSVLPIVGRAFSEHPSEKCLERLQLAGNGGWISVRLNRPPPHDDLVVEFVGMDAQFHPDAPGEYHLQAQRAVQAAEADDNGHNNDNNNHGSAASRTNSGEDLSSIDDNSGPSDSSDMSPTGNSGNAPQHRRTIYSKRNKNSASHNSNPSSHANHPKSGVENAKCLICLTEERNATIVHGETGHVACCLVCARILKARGDKCPVCRLEIDKVIQQFWA